MAGTNADPLVGFSFALQVGPVTGYFTKVEGLGSETQVIDHKVVDQNGKDLVKKIPGRLEWGDITLSRGITNAMDMWDWRKQVEDGKVEEARQNGSVMLFDQTGTIVAQWDFVNAWPSKMDGPSLSADGNEVTIESITLVHEGIIRTK
jgi:phage tail-like protein